MSKDWQQWGLNSCELNATWELTLILENIIVEARRERVFLHMVKNATKVLEIWLIFFEVLRNEASWALGSLCGYLHILDQIYFICHSSILFFPYAQCFVFWRCGWFLFLTGNECCERLAYYGISTNMVTYLGTNLHQGSAAAANNVTNWGGTCYITPLIGAFFADSYLGRFWTIAIFSTIYCCVRVSEQLSLPL